jgi:hypothetical protein
MTAVTEALDDISSTREAARHTSVWSKRGPDPASDCRIEEDAARLSAMQRAYCPTGGILSGDSLSLLLRERSDQPISLLARWIVRRRIVSFEAHRQRWVPMFQFDPVTMNVIDGAQRAIAELRDVFDDWELMVWFATSNAWLGGDSPANAMAADAPGVLAAARADRFVAAG